MGTVACVSLLKLVIMRCMFILLVLIFLTVAYGFQKMSSIRLQSHLTPTMSMKTEEHGIFDPIDFVVDEPVESGTSMSRNNINPMAYAPLSLLLLPLQAAHAKGGEFGIFEGRIASMLHPVTMAALFLTSLYSGYLGLQWRQLRTLGEDIKELNKQFPKLSAASAPVRFPLSNVISAVEKEVVVAGEDAEMVARLKQDIARLQGAMDVDVKIAELTAKRKELQTKDLRDKHWATGSILLGVGVGVSILGGFNTYLRAGKLFPGPHLYAGMAITGLWAAASALVPAMQKGNENARSAHIALNCINMALFAWQVNTGIGITLKVIEFTKFP